MTAVIAAGLSVAGRHFGTGVGGHLLHSPCSEDVHADSSNLAVTAMALVIGVVGAAIIEALWWLQGAFIGERQRLWK
jgi:hypothetical protein